MIHPYPYRTMLNACKNLEEIHIVQRRFLDDFKGKSSDRFRLKIYRNTPLYIASDLGATSAVRVLLREGVCPNDQQSTTDERTDETPLLIASKNGYIEIVNILIEAGADPNIDDNYCYSPLIHACEQGHFDIVRRLVEANASFKGNLDDGATALSMAVLNDHIEIARFLLEKGFKNINYTIGREWKGDVEETILCMVSRNGNVEMADLLKSYGATL